METTTPSPSRHSSELTTPVLPGAPLSPHPAAALFPMLPEAELKALAQDIKEHGQRQPIVVYKGQVLDGRNRREACRIARIEPWVVEWDGAGGDPVAYVLSVNLHRRHLNESQRAMVAARLKVMFEEGAHQRMLAGTPPANLPEGGESRSKAAKMLNFSARTVENASKVLRDGVPGLVAAVERGEAAVSAAAVVAGAQKADQQKIVARGEKAITQAAKTIKERRPKRAKPASKQATEAPKVDAGVEADPAPHPDAESTSAQASDLAASHTDPGASDPPVQKKDANRITHHWNSGSVSSVILSSLDATDLDEAEREAVEAAGRRVVATLEAFRAKQVEAETESVPAGRPPMSLRPWSGRRPRSAAQRARSSTRR